jgi:hypothetical protein
VVVTSAVNLGQIDLIDSSLAGISNAAVASVLYSSQFQIITIFNPLRIIKAEGEQNLQQSHVESSALFEHSREREEGRNLQF